MLVRSLLLPLLAGGAGLGIATTLAGPRDEPTRSAPVILDRRSADFREDEDPSRVIAALEAVLSRDGEHRTLSIHASAIGPRIVPPPGAEALSGSNRIAARELAAIVEEGRAEFRITGPAGSSSRGRVRAGRRGVILQRNLLADGRVEHVPAGGNDHQVETVFEAPIDVDGRYSVEVVVDGHVRARSSCIVMGATGRITLLEGVGEHDAPKDRP